MYYSLRYYIILPKEQSSIFKRIEFVLKRIINNMYIISFIKKGSTIVFGLIAVAFLSRAMGPTIKGEYDTYMNIVNILNVILFMGISSIYPNYVRRKEAWTESTFIFFSVIQFFCYVLCSGILYFTLHISIYSVVGLCIACSVLSIQLNGISLVETYLWNALANIASGFVNATLALVIFFTSVKNVELIMLAFCVKELVLCILVLCFLKSHIKAKEVKWSRMWEMMKRGFVPMLTNLLIMINYRIDVIFLNVYNVKYYQIGLYTAGLGLAEYAWIIPDIFKDVLINKTAKEDDLDSVKFCLRISSTFMIIIYLGILLFGKYAILLLYGKSYLNALQVTNIVFFGIYGMVYCKLLGTLYLAQGRWNFYCLTLLGAVIINVIANNIFIPLFGINGAAFTTIVAYSFAGMVFLHNFKRQYKFSLKELVLINTLDIKNIKSLLVKKSVKKGGRGKL